MAERPLLILPEATSATRGKKGGGGSGLAVQLPIEMVQQVLNTQTRDQVQLVQSEQIQFFRAAGQMAARAGGEEPVVHDLHGTATGRIATGCASGWPSAAEPRSLGGPSPR